MQSIPLLEPTECERSRRLVHSLRDEWIQRAPLPFFTLGAATYLDVARGQRTAYLERVERLNPVLDGHFGWLYDRVFKTLAEAVGGDVMPAPGLAVPGFHIFLAHPAFTQPLASVHLDLQYREHPWATLGEPDFDRPVSFTLAISLPADGGGLFVWPQGIAEARCRTDDEMAALLRRQAPQYKPYAVGSMIVHDGHLVHQIAPAPSISPGDERITLQGHVLRCGGRWFVYW